MTLSVAGAASERENSLNKFSHCYAEFVFMNLLSLVLNDGTGSRSNAARNCKGHHRKASRDQSSFRVRWRSEERRIRPVIWFMKMMNCQTG